MTKHGDNRISGKQINDSGAASPTGAEAVSGAFVSQVFESDGGRQVTVYVPPGAVEAILFAGDGQMISKWGPVLEKVDVPRTMIVGVREVFRRERSGVDRGAVWREVAG